MNSRLKTIGISLAGVLAFLLLAGGVAVLYALIGYRKAWDVPLPPTHAVRDAAVIARGRYIVYGPGRCADGHAPDAARPRLSRGEEAPLTGGRAKRRISERGAPPT